jgi:hypothetical protein
MFSLQVCISNSGNFFIVSADLKLIEINNKVKKLFNNVYILSFFFPPLIKFNPLQKIILKKNQFE